MPYTYVKDPAQARGRAMALTFLPMVILVVGGLIGACRYLFYVH